MGCKLPDPTTNPDMDEILSHVTTGNARPVLFEIKYALDKLLKTDEPTTIDLGAIPFAPGDDRILNDALGEGEVQATLNVMGTSYVRETAIPGVWRVDHLDQGGEFQSRFIEITFMPDILITQREDAEQGLDTLSQHLDAHALSDEG